MFRSKIFEPTLTGNPLPHIYRKVYKSPVTKAAVHFCSSKIYEIFENR